MDKISLEEQARIGIMEAVGNYTVCIDAPYPNKPNWGTGTLLKDKDRVFIATCEHVIPHNYPNGKLRVLYKGNSTKQWVEKEKIKTMSLEKMHREVARTYAQEISVRRKIYSDDSEDDLLLIELEPSTQIPDGADFFDIAKVKPPEIGMIAYLMGFSQELVREVAKKCLACFPYFESSMIMKNNGSLPGFDPKKHFLTEYEPTASSVDPHGLSGCGVWTRLPSGKDGIWTPNLYLIGIQHGHYPKSQFLISTRIERLLRILSN